MIFRWDERQLGFKLKNINSIKLESFFNFIKLERSEIYLWRRAETFKNYRRTQGKGNKTGRVSRNDEIKKNKGKGGEKPGS